MTTQSTGQQLIGLYGGTRNGLGNTGARGCMGVEWELEEVKMTLCVETSNFGSWNRLSADI